MLPLTSLYIAVVVRTQGKAVKVNICSFFDKHCTCVKGRILRIKYCSLPPEWALVAPERFDVIHYDGDVFLHRLWV